ncbi:MAG: trypsin-like peptidase domain-containing protein [Fimbriimonadia bacterium]|jgi:serine protease Do
MKGWLSRLFQTPAGMYISIGMLIGATATVAIISYRAVPAQAGIVTASSLTNAEEATLATIESAFTKIVEQTSPAVVSIQAKKDMAASGISIFGSVPSLQGQGSGVVIRSDGWILTNDHVVRGADKVTVEFADGRRLEGTVRRDYLGDVAVVKVDANNLPTLQLANSDEVKPGQFAIAIGSPFGLENTVTIGHISAISRAQYVPDSTPRLLMPRGQDPRNLPPGRYYPTLIQTDAAINPGNSGGPLINIHGEVIGINTAIASDMGGNVGVGFAIPINIAQDIANQLINKGRVARGYLGVEPADLSAEDRDRLGINSGALVKSVQKGDPADKAGIKADDVVIEINGTKINRAVDLRMKMLHVPPGEQATLKVVRGGKTLTMNVMVGSPPMDPDLGQHLERDLAEGDEAPKLDLPVRGRLGAAVAEITEDARKEYKLPQGLSGVVVVEVQPGTPADRVGLRPGDVIEQFNGKKLRTPDELRSLVEKAQGNYSLVVRRSIGGQMATIQIQIRE